VNGWAAQATLDVGAFTVVAGRRLGLGKGNTLFKVCAASVARKFINWHCSTPLSDPQAISQRRFFISIKIRHRKEGGVTLPLPKDMPLLLARNWRSISDLSELTDGVVIAALWYDQPTKKKS
jgi:hypothetical protein